MFKPIEINYQWNEALALKTSKLYYDYDMQHSNKRYVGWFFVGLVQFGIVGALKHDSFGLLYLSTFLVLYWYYGRWYLRKRMLLQFYKNNIAKDLEVHFTLKEDGLHGQGKTILWDDILKIIPLEEGILVQGKEEALFFEKSAFVSNAEKERSLTLAKERDKV